MKDYSGVLYQMYLDLQKIKYDLKLSKKDVEIVYSNFKIEYEFAKQKVKYIDNLKSKMGNKQCLLNTMHSLLIRNYKFIISRQSGVCQIQFYIQLLNFYNLYFSNMKDMVVYIVNKNSLCGGNA